MDELSRRILRRLFPKRRVGDFAFSSSSGGGGGGGGRIYCAAGVAVVRASMVVLRQFQSRGGGGGGGHWIPVMMGLRMGKRCRIGIWVSFSCRVVEILRSRFRGD